jgi:hypothetical protein
MRIEMSPGPARDFGRSQWRRYVRAFDPQQSRTVHYAKEPMRASRVKAITQNQADMGPSGSDFSWRNDDLAMFNLAIGSELRACDLTALKVDDVAMSGHVKSHGDPKENWAAGPVRNHRADEGYGCSLDRYGRTSLRPLPLPQPHLCGTSDTYSPVCRTGLTLDRIAWPRPCEVRHAFAAVHEADINLSSDRKPARGTAGAWHAKLETTRYHDYC